ncbi:hypothetical protein GCM10027321_03490 [Massilia terrae]|uniref:Nuclear transport factor 2 family protein n=1 Tax=Massilia terrae TaxID=1811224 RepID=A0ABT2CTH7_9BURK|nr:nuclear transport factor 2 family protein [Massilia terrae]MCS0657287.1 nuclear transport factor 2 family protein [Massilia terrae]
MNKARLGALLALAILPLCLSGPALAGPIDEAKARAHLDAVAAGDLEGLMRDYAEDAYLDWVGGPLEGRYRGKAQIRALWEKWIGANKGQPRPVQRGALNAFANKTGASIEAKAAYEGAVPVKVWHVLTYRDGELDTEIWQIAPALQIEK